MRKRPGTGRRGATRQARDRPTGEERTSDTLRLLLQADGNIVERLSHRRPKDLPTWGLELRFDPDPVSGQYVCSRLVIEPSFLADLPPAGITSRLLHKIRMGEVRDRFTRNLKAEQLFFGRAPRYKPPSPENRQGPVGWGEEHYRRTAKLYVQAVETAPRRPIRWMVDYYLKQEELTYSLTTIRGQVNRARELGFLERPGMGKVGAVPTEKLIQGGSENRAGDSSGRRKR